MIEATNINNFEIIENPFKVFSLMNYRIKKKQSTKIPIFEIVQAQLTIFERPLIKKLVISEHSHIKE